MEPVCDGCGVNVSACVGLLERCQLRLVLAAVHRLLVAGEDPKRSLRARQHHRALARRRLRAFLAEEAARAPWPTCARIVDDRGAA